MGDKSKNRVIILKDAAIFASPTVTIPVLNEVNLTVLEGELVYLVGQVGSGKSSLLRTLCAELPLRKGGGTVCGYNLRDLSIYDFHELRRTLGVIFQDNNLLEDRDVYGNLEFVLRATGWKRRDEIHQRIGEVLDMVEMTAKVGRKPSNISGGERQRVCIARAMLNSPKLILADEPTGNLDPVTAANVLSLFNHISQENQCAVMITTHNSENLRVLPARALRCAGGFIEEL